MQSHRNQFKQHSDIRYVMDSSITIIFFMILGMKRSLSLTVGSFFLEISNELVMIRLRGGSLIFSFFNINHSSSTRGSSSVEELVQVSQFRISGQ